MSIHYASAQKALAMTGSIKQIGSTVTEMQKSHRAAKKRGDVDSSERSIVVARNRRRHRGFEEVDSRNGSVGRGDPSGGSEGLRIDGLTCQKKNGL